MIPADLQIFIVLLLVAVVFLAFIKEILPPDVVAMSAVAILLTLGILDSKEVLSVFSNNATMIIACMFILSAALERTGIVEAVGQFLTSHAKDRPTLTIGGLMAAVMVMSIFINNTTVVVIITPIMIKIATTLGRNPSKYLIPLSYCSIFAGTTTIIGTSTNLLVDGVARESGMEPFSMFEITIPGLMLGSIGVTYLFLFGRRFLPDRQPHITEFTNSEERRFLTEILIPHDSPLADKTLEKTGLLKKNNFEIIGIIREGISLPADPQLALKAGDRLSTITNQREISWINEVDELVFNEDNDHLIEEISSQESQVMEGIIGPHSNYIGKTIAELNLTSNFNIKVLGIHRPKGKIRKNLDRIVLSYGDTIIFEGTATSIKNLFDTHQLVNVTQPQLKPYRRRRAPIALLAIISVIVLAALNIMPISGLAIIAATVVVVLRCIDIDEAYDSIQWQLLILIFAMLALSIAMQKTGAIDLVANSIINLFDGASPIVMLSILYLLTSIMTEIFSNSASAVLMTTIAIGMANTLGVDPRPFAVAVMFGASASFATPIGYQTNTFVYNAGGYKFIDFVKVGLPLNILLWIAATFIIPLFWPL